MGRHRRSLLVLAGLLAILAVWVSVVAGVDPVVGPFPRSTVPTSSFPLAAPDGSCAAPSYAFSSETGTGLTRSAASQLGIALGGTCAYTLTSTALLPVTDNAVALGNLTTKRLSTVNVATGYYSGNSQMTDGAGNLLVASVGPHAIGGAAVTTAMLTLQGTFAGTAAGANGFVMSPTLTPAANGGSTVYNLTPTITPASSGTHSILVGARIAPAYTGGMASSVTSAEAVRIVGGFAAPANTTTATALRITNQPSGATSNYAIFVDGGAIRLDGSVGVGGVTLPSTTAGGLALAATAFASLPADVNGTFRNCSDCDPPGAINAACTSAGAKTGALAYRVNGAWRCLVG